MVCQQTLDINMILPQLGVTQLPFGSLSRYVDPSAHTYLDVQKLHKYVVVPDSVFTGGALTQLP